MSSIQKANEKFCFHKKSTDLSRFFGSTIKIISGVFSTRNIPLKTEKRKAFSGSSRKISRSPIQEIISCWSFWIIPSILPGTPLMSVLRGV
jgi:hypothetical protein